MLNCKKGGLYFLSTAQIYLNMAVACHHVGRLEEAAEMAGKLDALHNPYENFWFTALYAMQGDLDQAFARFELLSREIPRHYVAWEPRLKAMMKDPCWEPALAQFESVYESLDSTDFQAAMEAVISQDSKLGAARNEATRAQPIASVIENYVEALDALDLQQCPQDFAKAIRRHADAWRESISFFAQFEDLRGELHEVFEMIREQGGSARTGLEQAEAAIWSTWADVEKAMENQQ